MTGGSQRFVLDGDADKYVHGRKSMEFIAADIANGVQLGCPVICASPKPMEPESTCQIVPWVLAGQVPKANGKYDYSHLPTKLKLTFPTDGGPWRWASTAFVRPEWKVTDSMNGIVPVADFMAEAYTLNQTDDLEWTWWGTSPTYNRLCERIGPGGYYAACNQPYKILGLQLKVVSCQPQLYISFQIFEPVYESYPAAEVSMGYVDTVTHDRWIANGHTPPSGLSSWPKPPITYRDFSAIGGLDYWVRNYEGGFASENVNALFSYTIEPSGLLAHPYYATHQYLGYPELSALQLGWNPALMDQNKISDGDTLFHKSFNNISEVPAPWEDVEFIYPDSSYIDEPDLGDLDGPGTTPGFGGPDYLYSWWSRYRAPESNKGVVTTEVAPFWHDGTLSTDPVFTPSPSVDIPILQWQIEAA